MKQFFTILVALGVLIHAALGCCSHHQHAPIAELRAGAIQMQGCCTHHHHAGDRGREAGDRAAGREGPHKKNHPDECQDGKCYSLPPDSTFGLQVFESPLVVWMIHAPPESAVSGSSAAFLAAARRNAVDPAPVRAHLLHQIFLI